jgi:hypothetical protein
MTDQPEAASDAEAKLLRYEVALQKGLDARLAERLRGSSREELEADADTLAALAHRYQAQHAPNYDGGVRTPPPRQRDMNDVLRDLFNSRIRY